MGCGSGMTCWRRLTEWHEAGVWEELHKILLGSLAEAEQIDWSRASVDSASVAAPRGGSNTGPNPTDRGKSGTKHHILVDCGGIPLAATHSGANVHDSKMFEVVVDAVEAVKGVGRGRPRKRPEKLHADKAYDARKCRQALERRGIKVRIARKGIESSERLRRYRWVVKRTISWLHRNRRLSVRHERRADTHQAFLDLGCSLICWNQIQRLC